MTDDGLDLLRTLAGNAISKGGPPGPDVRAALLAFARNMDPELPQTAELVQIAERDGDGELLGMLALAPPEAPKAPAEWPIAATVEAPIWGRDVEIPPLLYLVEAEPQKPEGKPAGVIELGTAGYLVGAGGVGKGWVALDLAVAVAAGNPHANRTANPRWLGPKGYTVAHPGHVLFLTAEDRKRHIQWRLRALMLGRGLEGATLARAMERLHVVCTQDTPGMRGLRLQDPEGEQTAECLALLERLRATAAVRLRMLEAQGGGIDAHDGSVPWRLIVIDTLSRTASPEAETDQDHAARFTELLEGLTDCNPEGFPQAVTIAIHHAGKGTSNKQGAHQARGASALTDNARWVGTINDLPSDIGGRLRNWRRLDVAKVNHGPRIPLRYLRQREGEADGGVIDAMLQEEYDDEKKAADDEKKAAEGAAADGTASGTMGGPRRRKKAKATDLPDIGL